ncbi:MAG: Glycosyl transferase, family 2 [Microgenomates group bacterium GW2011_GWC1_39_7b]|uniref:Glycosyl transferase, family 2 n=3 Tax=Candidatus Woeseibacteriota TaxID=1752722 RepID=A0A0G0LIY3_9BACT|nr:MAG: Glycosyl transferase, family 2 [Candidatus Woesebacteria bacterium GW2011_GWB1_39_10]KKR27049.1 MAG: Glycosyl transferase, family 2 [Microgenomates group bacterium GW2011_GWC1_39_7b]KKR74131.1 MAG: Glycosyl transferase, family 2 [Candidatus Woesebacteria bacterium GW2011_GWA2_40_7]KKS90848.1 MAG: Glycosyl transferase, family 2 [Candidatus Woesebacteria bacterium GW2011_GWA1_43_12]
MNSKNFSVSIVVPNYNGEKLIEKNLPRVLDAKNDSRNQIKEIIIVDDGSIDASVSLIKNKFSSVKLIKHVKNRGFSAGVNTGVRAAKGDLILLLNTDVLPEENFLAPIFKHFEDKRTFAVSLHENGYGWAGGSFAEGFIQLSMGKESIDPHSSFYVSGGSGVFRRSIWVELGGMDEKLLSPFYWEDIDICYRAAKRGYLNLWEPDGHVVHNHESTISTFSKSYVQKVRERNQLLMLWKNIHSQNLIRKHIAGLFMRLIKHPGYIRVVLMALGRLGIAIKARKKEIKDSKVSDEAIFSKFTG